MKSCRFKFGCILRCLPFLLVFVCTVNIFFGEQWMTSGKDDYWNRILFVSSVIDEKPTTTTVLSANENLLIEARRRYGFKYFIVEDKNISITRRRHIQQTKEQNELQICFIKTSYAESTSKGDDLNHASNNMTSFQHEFPNTKFYLFTNLIDDDKTNSNSTTKSSSSSSNGWTKIIFEPSLPYKRQITQSRYGKFLAWILPEIYESCDVIFYLDGSMIPRKNRHKDILKLSQKIKTSNRGLMQLKHYIYTQMNDSQVYGPMEEYDLIVKLKKDTVDNVAKSIDWLNSQPDFDNNSTTIWANTYFGYDPQNLKYQYLSLQFWDHYSLEQDSWRDQGLWAYMLRKHFGVPLQFPVKKHHLLFYDEKQIKGYNGHQYVS